MHYPEEIAEIAIAMERNPLLYQTMKAAVEVRSSEAIKQAADFLKGAKRRRDICSLKSFWTGSGT